MVKGNMAKFSLLIFLLLLLWVLSMTLGSVHIPIDEILYTVLGTQSYESPHDYILSEIRIPKAITSFFVGGGLGISGLVMQTYFRNPLAGPYVLGVSSGASLGAAIYVLGGSLIGGLWFQTSSLVISACLGSLLVLLLLFWIARGVLDNMALLIIGIMLSSITTAVVSILAYWSDASALQRYVFWSFGNLGGLSWLQIQILVAVITAGFALLWAGQKNLNILMLGEKEVFNMGVNFKLIRLKIFIVVGVIGGVITAFVGPIGFIGLAVPHLTKLWFKTLDHKILMPTAFLIGGALLLLCSLLTQLPQEARILPLNAVTSLFGAPLVIWLLIKTKKMIF